MNLYFGLVVKVFNYFFPCLLLPLLSILRTHLVGVPLG